MKEQFMIVSEYSLNPKNQDMTGAPHNENQAPPKNQAPPNININVLFCSTNLSKPSNKEICLPSLKRLIYIIYMYIILITKHSCIYNGNLTRDIQI